MGKGRVKSASVANANWKSAMQSPQAAEKYRQGVQGVQVSPNAMAATPEAIAKYQQKTQEAVASGRMAAKNNSVPLQKWQAAAQAGASRLSTGAANGAAAHLAAAQKMEAGWQNARDAANAIPNDGSEGAYMARIAASIRAMKAAAGKS